MTVKELIKKLKKFNPDLEVYGLDVYGLEYEPVEDVDTEYVTESEQSFFAVEPSNKSVEGSFKAVIIQ